MFTLLLCASLGQISNMEMQRGDFAVLDPASPTANLRYNKAWSDPSLAGRVKPDVIVPPYHYGVVIDKITYGGDYYYVFKANVDTITLHSMMVRKINLPLSKKIYSEMTTEEQKIPQAKRKNEMRVYKNRIKQVWEKIAKQNNTTLAQVQMVRKVGHANNW